MKVLFIVPDYNYLKHFMPDYRGSFHHGVAYMSSYLKMHGHDVSLLHLLSPASKQGLVESVKSHSPDLIAFTSFTHQFKEVKRLASILKANFNLPFICGGVHCTIDAERALLESDFDMICVGEGEESMLELANAIQKGNKYDDINNIWLKRNGKIIKNPVRPFLDDLDSLPFPDWELFSYENLTEGNIQKRLSILATRGCPNNCSFCSNHAIKSVYPNKNKYVRRRQPAKVIEEIGIMMRRYPYSKEICFLDDTMGLDLEWLEEFSFLYSGTFSLPIHCNTRVEIINNDRKLSCFTRMGVKTVGLGFESGNGRMRLLMNRRITNEDMIRAVLRCHEAGIKALTYNIVGLPSENINNILETIYLNVQARSDMIHVSIFQPYPGTDLYKRCVENDYIRDGQFCEGFFDKTILRQKLLSSMSIKFSHRFFQSYVIFFRLAEELPYPFKRVIKKILAYTFRNKVSQRCIIAIYPLLAAVIARPFLKNKLKSIIKSYLKNEDK